MKWGAGQTPGLRLPRVAAMALGDIAAFSLLWLAAGLWPEGLRKWLSPED